MNFSSLADCHQKWRDLLVIGRTIERNGKQYYILGMTLAEEAKLYILEPNCEATDVERSKKGPMTQRKRLKQHGESSFGYLDCSDFYVGDKRFSVQGGSGGSLAYALQDYTMIQLFCDMLGAGWVIPAWLQQVEWSDLQLVTLNIPDIKKLPRFTSETPLTIKHRPSPLRHSIEKAITLGVGQKRSFSFTDAHGDKVRCYINRVNLIDVWQTVEEQFCSPQYAQRSAPEALQQTKKRFFETLAQSCPKGMCYVAVEYECSKEMSLQFYSKQFLKASPVQGKGQAASMGIILKPDATTGMHGLPLKGCVIQTAVSPDTAEMAAELLFGFEKVEIWEERVIVS